MSDYTWHGDTLGDPTQLAVIWIGNDRQILFADLLEIGLHHLNAAGRENVLRQVAICWEKGILHPVDLAAMEDYCRKNLPPALWQPGRWDKGAQ